MPWMLSWFLLLSLVLGPELGQAAAPPATRPVLSLPARLQPYAEFSEQCARHQVMVSGSEWRTVYHETFTSAAKPTWKALGDDAQPPAANQAGQPERCKIIKDDGVSVLFFQSPGEQGHLAIGPKVSGDFVVEFTARSDADEPCDMSIVCDKVDVGPSFQFGAHYNTRNKLFIGPEPGANGDAQEKYIDLPADQLIRKNTWHRVRLEVRDGQVAASVDGKLLGKAALARGYDRARERQPMIYVYSSAIQVREARIELMAQGGAKKDPQAAWKQAFGDATRAQVDEKIAFLVSCLGDDEESVRDAAQGLLRRIGDLAVPALQAAVKTGLPEERQRAQDILNAIRPVARPVTRTPGPQPAAEP